VPKRYPKSFQRLILVGFLLVALPLALAIGYAVFTLQGLAAQSEQAVERASGAARASRQIAESLLGMERVLRQYVVVRDAELLEDYRRLRADFRQVAGGLAGTALDNASGNRVGALLEREQKISARLMEAGPPDRPLDDLIDEFQAMADDALPLVEAARAVADAEVARLEQEASRARDALLLPLLAALALALAIAWWFRNLITAQIAQIDQAIRAIGRGDYARTIHVTGPDDLSFLGQRLDWLRQRLAELEEQKSRFLRHVSHDLKTPLTAIREGAQLLADEVPGPLADGQRSIVSIMTQNSLRLQTLIEELLNYQQASLAAGNLDLQPVALEAVADRVLHTHRLAASARSIRFQKVLPPVQVEGDPEKLRVVVDNLITNAIKFSPREGVVRVLLKSEGGSAVLDVIDEGAGVPEAERERIFDAFYRGKRTADGVEGSGLGLAIAREYVSAHRGKIEVVGDAGGGGHFRVTLPKVRKERAR
jgi:two-component system, NtrC family, sensor histidine kinase GlrK